MFLRRFLKIGKGKVPVILSCVHGGSKKPKNIPDKIYGFKKSDKNTYQIVEQIIDTLKKQEVKIYYILSMIHRSKVDLNRPESSLDAFYRSSRRARRFHRQFHKKLSVMARKLRKKYGKCIIIDIHGFTKPHEGYPDIIFGHLYGKTLNLLEDNKNLESNHKRGFYLLKEEISKDFTLDDGLLMNQLNIEYCGGYITQRFYETAKIEVIQIEIAKKLRLEPEFREKIINAIVRAIKGFT
jgi:N-formylglutamate amidohydrolase